MPRRRRASTHSPPPPLRPHPILLAAPAATQPPPSPFHDWIDTPQWLPARRRGLRRAGRGGGDGELAPVLRVRLAAGVRSAGRGRRRGAHAARAQPGARALLHLRRPQLPAPLRRRQGPPRHCDAAAGEGRGCERAELLRPGTASCFFNVCLTMGL